MTFEENYREYLDLETFTQAIQRNIDCTDRGYTFIQNNGSEHVLSWAELSREARHRGQMLLARGLRKGDSLALIIPEGEEFVLTLLGAMSVGIVPVPMYPPLALGKLDAYIDSVARILEIAGATMLISTRRVLKVLWSLMDKARCLQHIESVDIFAEELPAHAPEPDELSPDDVALLQFTSGSTAAPKGVRVTHRSLLANCLGIMAHGLRVERGRDSGVSWLPMYHDMGLIGFVLAPLIGRYPVVFIPTLQFVRSPQIWMETVSRHRATITFAPNFALAVAVKHVPASMLEELDLSCLRAVGCGAEPNHPDTLRAFVDHFARAGLRPEALLPCYGMAEATLAISFVDTDECFTTDIIDGELYHGQGVARPVSGDDTTAHRLEFVSCGRPLPGHEVSIIDDEGNELPARRVGEIVFRGPSVAGGYHGTSHESGRIFTEKGLRTGDCGYLADGVLYVTGRKKDILIINGRNYDPQTVEWAAAEVPHLRKGNVVAFTRPGETTEELVIVAETRLADTGALREEVRKRVQSELSLPVSDIVFLAPGTLAKTSSGKLQRSKTREQYLRGTLGSEGHRTPGQRGSALTMARHMMRSLVSRVRHAIRRRT